MEIKAAKFRNAGIHDRLFPMSQLEFADSTVDSLLEGSAMRCKWIQKYIEEVQRWSHESSSHVGFTGIHTRRNNSCEVVDESACTIFIGLYLVGIGEQTGGLFRVPFVLSKILFSLYCEQLSVGLGLS